jgi:hypothetical protein
MMAGWGARGVCGREEEAQESGVGRFFSKPGLEPNLAARACG